MHSNNTWPALIKSECDGLEKQTSLAPKDHLKYFLSKSKKYFVGKIAPNKSGSSIHESWFDTVMSGFPLGLFLTKSNSCERLWTWVSLSTSFDDDRKNKFY